MTEVVHPHKLDEFNDSEVQEYLRNPNKCPYCRSTHICRTGADWEEVDFITHVIKCYDCEHKWAEVYNLVAIEVYGEDPYVTEAF